MGWSRGWCINLHQPHPQCHLPNHSSVPGPALKCGREAWGAPFSPKTRHFIESPCLAAGKPTTVPRETEAPSPTPFPGLRHSIGVSPAHPCTHPGLEVLGTPLTPKGPSQTPPPPPGLGRPNTPLHPTEGAVCVCLNTALLRCQKPWGGGTLSSPFSPAKGLGGALSSSLIPHQRGPSVPPTPKGPSPPCLVPSPKAPEGTPAASFSQAKGPEGPPPSPQGSGGPSASPPPPGTGPGRTLRVTSQSLPCRRISPITP